MRPGLLTTVQDLGRWGFQSLGVPVAGAMDSFSHRVANVLVGNDESAATLEVTLTGPELVFNDERTVAVAGAEFELTVDGRPVPRAMAFTVAKDGVLRFGPRVSGARAYVAIAGGIDVPRVLGSRSTYLPARLGGHGGRGLRAGDRVLLGQTPPDGARSRRIAARAITSQDISSQGLSSEGIAGQGDALQRFAQHGERGTAIGDRPVRVLAAQDDRFTGDALEVLQSGRYLVLPDSDRTGFRLGGPALRHAHSAEIISDATPSGTLQVPPSGQPILLMADRPTTGGYAKLATVISADLGRVAQAAPGDFLTFATCQQAEALSALIAQERIVLACAVA